MSHHDPAALTRWREAEVAIGTDELEARASALPVRLGWLLRAIDALDRGDLEQIESVRQGALTAQQPDIVAVLELVRTPPEAIDPTEVRKHAKRAKLDARSGLPFLDLLRSTAVALRGESKPASKTLREASYLRPTLNATVEVLSYNGQNGWIWEALAESMPRAGQVLSSAGLVLGGRGLPSQGALARKYPGIQLDLDPARWQTPETDSEPVLRDRLSGHHPWTSPHDSHNTWLYTRPKAVQRRWLGSLVRALAARVHAGTLVDTSDLAHTAAHLAFDLGMPPLAIQLVTAEEQLQWASNPGGELDPAAAELMWSARGRLSEVERLVVATESMPLIKFISPADAVEIALLVAARSPTTPMVNAATSMLTELLPPSQLRGRLLGLGADPARLVFAAGLFDADRGSAAGALSAAARLASEGHYDHGFDILESLLRVLPDDACASGALRRSFATAIDPLSAASPTADRVRILSRMYRRVESASPVLQAAIVDWLDASPPTILGATLGLAVLAHQDEQAKTAVRRVGRLLQRAASPDAGSALCASVLGAALAILGPDARTTTVLLPLQRFLERQGVDHAVNTARALPEGSPEALGMMTWGLQSPTIRAHGDWRAWTTDFLVRQFANHEFIDPAEVKAVVRRCLRMPVASYGQLHSAIEDELVADFAVPEAFHELVQMMGGLNDPMP